VIWSKRKITGVTPVIFCLMSEAGAALQAAALQNSAASTTSHALHKTVLMRAVTLLWLVRSFWHWLNKLS
jgi:hypothetical protein